MEGARPNWLSASATRLRDLPGDRQLAPVGYGDAGEPAPELEQIIAAG